MIDMYVDSSFMLYLDTFLTRLGSSYIGLLLPTHTPRLFLSSEQPPLCPDRLPAGPGDGPVRLGGVLSDRDSVQ